MTTHPTPAPLPANGGQVLDDDAVALLARQLGQDPDALRAQLLGTAAAPLVRDHIDDYLKRCTKRTRGTYATAIRRLRDGVGAVCDQTCEPCLGAGFTCRCNCAACRSSRVSVPALGDQRVSAASYSRANVLALAAVSRRMAVKKGIVDNRRRANRGQVAKNGDGYGADRERGVGAVAATRRGLLFGALGDECPAVGDHDVERAVGPAEQVGEAAFAELQLDPVRGVEPAGAAPDREPAGHGSGLRGEEAQRAGVPPGGTGVGGHGADPPEPGARQLGLLALVDR